jgi:hypothetical protein
MSMGYFAGLGELLLLDCGVCYWPSDVRNETCRRLVKVGARLLGGVRQSYESAERQVGLGVLA